VHHQVEIELTGGDGDGDRVNQERHVVGDDEKHGVLARAAAFYI
jgi:hypothetical protein